MIKVGYISIIYAFHTNSDSPKNNTKLKKRFYPWIGVIDRQKIGLTATVSGRGDFHSDLYICQCK